MKKTKQHTNVVALEEKHNKQRHSKSKNVVPLFMKNTAKQSRRKLYLASPLFSLAEQEFNRMLCSELTRLGYEVFLPQKFCAKISSLRRIAKQCKLHLDWTDVVVVNLDGADSDSGTSFEAGMVYNIKKTVGFRTDFRQSGDDSDTGSNVMFRLLETVVLYHGDSVSELAELIDSALR